MCSCTGARGSTVEWLHDSICVLIQGISSDSSDSQCTSSNSPKHKAGCKRGPGRPQVNDRIKNMKLSNRLFKNKVKKTEVGYIFKFKQIFVTCNLFYISSIFSPFITLNVEEFSYHSFSSLQSTKLLP